MIKESNNPIKFTEDILKIVKEDILRMLGETEKKISLETFKTEIKVSFSYIKKAVKDLEEKNLIRNEKKFVNLTNNGQKEAREILNKHLILEDYFKEKKEKAEAHKAAHILEHYISGEVIDDIRKLSTYRKEDVSLAGLGSGDQGIITDFLFSDYGLFERIVSMGIFLGEKIEIANEISSGFVLKIRNKKFALDGNIVKEIMVYPINYEKP